MIIPKLIKAINIPTTIKVMFFLASFTSAHLEDSIIHIIPLNITIVTARTIVILNKNLAILTISGASLVIPQRSTLTDHLKISLPTAFFPAQRLIIVSLVIAG
ncbi:MAG: hypothetical protein WCL18_02325 [bacterium]